VAGNRSRLLAWSGISFLIFAICCALIFWFHAEISRSTAATYLLLAATGVSAILGPVLGGRAAFDVFTKAVHRRFSKTTDSD
jgi:hypothetical protein